MKFYLTIILSLLVAPIVSMAALDASLTGATITVSGVNLMTVTDIGSADSIVVDSSDIKVVLSPGANITFSSSDRRDFTVTPYTFVSSETCDSSASTLRLYMDPSYISGTVATSTITLSSGTCDGSSGGGGGGGGSGGGGGGGYTPTQGATVTQTTTGQTITKTISTPSGIIITITKTLKVGSQNSEVRSLQQALAQDKTIYPEGKVTGYFGALTKKAVQNFQKKYGIASSGNENTTGYGLVGPKTLAKIKEVFGTAAASSSAQASSAASSAAPTTGSTGVTTSAMAKAQQIQNIQTLINQLLEQVKALQAKKTTQ